MADDWDSVTQVLASRALAVWVEVNTLARATQAALEPLERRSLATEDSQSALEVPTVDRVEAALCELLAASHALERVMAPVPLTTAGCSVVGGFGSG